MTPDTHPDDLIGVYVVDACSEPEARLVAEHARHCARCAAEIERLRRAGEWIGELTPRRAPRDLRSRVLTTALNARPPCAPEVEDLLAPYAAQVTAFGRLLAGLPAPAWRAPVGPHASVRELVTHLGANDELVATMVGVDPIESTMSTMDTVKGWRRRADVLVRTVSSQGPAVLDREVRLAGSAAIRRPLREALVQRAFETWIHAEDVRSLLTLPAQPPEPAQVTRIVDFGLRLLPAAMDAAGRGRPHQVLRLALTGPGGGERLVPLSSTTPTTGSTVVAEIVVAAELFCRHLAGRVDSPRANVSITGDAQAALDFLTVAATMGCD